MRLLSTIAAPTWVPRATQGRLPPPRLAHEVSEAASIGSEVSRATIDSERGAAVEDSLTTLRRQGTMFEFDGPVPPQAPSILGGQRYSCSDLGAELSEGSLGIDREISSMTEVSEASDRPPYHSERAPSGACTPASTTPSFSVRLPASSASGSSPADATCATGTGHSGSPLSLGAVAEELNPLSQLPFSSSPARRRKPPRSAPPAARSARLGSARAPQKAPQRVRSVLGATGRPEQREALSHVSFAVYKHFQCAL